MKRLLLAAALAAATSAAAQGYPARPVRVIVPFPAGGATDLVARLVTQRLSDSLGQQFFVENRGGAGGLVGSEAAAKAAPDGYTLAIGTSGTHAINFSLYKRPSYDPVKDFTALTRLAVLPSLILVHPSVPAKNLGELIAYAKQHPGKLAYASAGNLLYLTGAMFTSMAGIDMLHVPFKGAGPQIAAIANNDVQMAVTPVFSALPVLKAGKARALAVTSARRSVAAPEYPTVAESGLPGFEAVSWYALFAVAGTPKEVIARLSAETRKVLALPEVKEALLNQGAEPASDTPEEFAAIVRNDVAMWAKIVKQTGATAD
ncbi:MAG: tripartite tricarboxylate transporter substrate binding protein [Burkholderiales bacterium]|nr:tripartite tricarboxylate transporter substrate binding protein [Burkholderiales bacterium]